MSFFKKGKKLEGAEVEKKCFNCGKELQPGHYTFANKRYCCDKCCSNKDVKKGETCEFC